MKKLLFLLLILLLITACGKTDSKGGEINLEEIDDVEIKEFLENKLPEPKVTSFDKIEQAEEDGTIDEVQANTLKIIAGYSPEVLPSSYQSKDEVGRTSLQASKIWLRQNWDSLDEETQELLYPYKVLPNHPDSYLNQPSDSEKIVEALSIIPSVSAADIDWKYIVHTISTSPNRVANIYYPGSEKKPQAEMIAKAYDKAFKMFEPYFGVKPDQTTYVFIRPMSDYGTADTEVVDGKKRCIIEIQLDMDKKMTESTTAHELFHCFQFYLPLEYNPDDRRWLMEATATWSEHYVYPEYNREHEYLNGFFYDLAEKMIYFGDTREYQSYMWYLFLTQYTNSINAPIEALKKSKTQTATVAATEIPGFDNLFPEFALWNLNFGPVKKYMDSPNFPGKTPAGSSAYTEFNYEKNVKLPEVLVMDELAMGYHVSLFKPDVKKVLFEFENEGDEKHQRQAVIKIGGVWHIEDWTNIEEKRFCRTRAEEKVEAVVIIGSNSDKVNEYNEVFTVDTNGECQPTWHGTLKVTWFQDYNPSWMDGEVSRNIKNKGSYTATEELYFDDHYKSYDIIKHHGVYQSQNSQRDDYNQDCGYVFMASERKESGSYSKEYDKKNPGQKRFSIEYDYDDNPLDKATIELAPLGRDWVSYTDVSSGQEIRCGSGVSNTFRTPIEGKTSPDFSMPDNSEIEVDMDHDAKKLIGTTSYETNAGQEGSYTVNVAYHYEYS